MKTLSRRELLRLAGMSLFVALPRVSFGSFGADLSEPLAARLVRILSHASSAGAIGQRYLALRPDEADLQRLTALIARTHENYQQLERADAKDLRLRLALQMRQDFQHGRTIAVNGWILSETEGRLCAMSVIA